MRAARGWMLAVLLLLLVPVARPQASAPTVDIWLSGFHDLHGFLNGNYLYMGLYNSCSNEPRVDVANTPGLVCSDMPYYKIFYPAGSMTDSDESFYIWYDSLDRQWIITASVISISVTWESRALITTQEPQQVYDTALRWDEQVWGVWSSCSICQATTTPPVPPTSCDPAYTDCDGSGPGTTCCGCEAGKYKPNTGPETCTSCTAGMYTTEYSIPNTECIRCDGGHWSDVEGLHLLPGQGCYECEAGTYTADAGATVCNLCEAGTYTADAGATACNLCDAGKYSNAGSALCLVTPISCPPAYTDCDGDGAGTACCGCEAGKYKPDTGPGTCTLCAAGKYTTQYGLPMTGCFSCYGGHWSDEEGMHVGAGYSLGCNQCEAGTYTADAGATACNLCDAGKYSTLTAAVEPTVCLDCPSGKYQENSGRSVCTTCLAGKYSTIQAATTSYVCVTCDAGKYSNAGSALCQDCSAGKWSSAGATSCTTTAAPTTTTAAPTTTTPAPTTTTAAPTTTTPAPTSTTAAPTTNFEPLHCIACDAGFFRDQPTKTCTACPPGSSTFPYSNASSALHCLCRPGFENASEACGLCRRAFFKGELENSSCAQCHPDSQSPTPGATARADCLCHPGFFFAPDVRGEKSCTACDAGTYKGDLADVLCTECPPDHYCPAGANATEACPLHSFSAAGSVRVEDCLCVQGFFFDYSTGRYACHACAPGTYSDRAGEPACTACPANTYNPSSLGSSVDDCRSCTPNSASAPGSSVEANCTCNLGYAGDPGDSCTPCAPGQYRENSAVYICEACPPNTFSRRVASESAGFCGVCPLNTSSGAGSGSERDCVCDPGLYADADLSCAPCAPGTFATGYNSSSCAACEPGKFSAALGANSGETCGECPPGTYGTEAGMTACLPCPPSTWQNASVPAQRARECTACPAHSSHGAHGVTDVFTCECAAGFWKRPEAPAFECSECLAGHFCPGADRLLPCPFNTFATGGLLTACTPCAPFSKATANASLTGPEQCQCSPGASGAFHTACAPCAAGYFQAKDHTHGGADALQAQLAVQAESGAAVGAPAAQLTVCVPCAEHTFQNTTGSVACHPCPPHSSTENSASADATLCKCNPGHFGVSGQTCDLCEADSFCPGATVMNPCRAHSSAGTGARAEDDCKCNGGFYSAAPAGLCSLCPRSMYCPGDLAVLACANASSSDPGAQSISACACFAGHWRGCIKNATGVHIDNRLLPCTIDYAIPCFQCESNDICFNETLKQCPGHSTSPAGSDDDRDCVCDPGYFGLYGEDNDAYV